MTIINKVIILEIKVTSFNPLSGFGITTERTTTVKKVLSLLSETLKAI
jgi:hypothetical protein